MSTPKFHSDDPRLTAFALGELDGAERTAIEQWLEQSSEAQAELAEIRETVRLLRAELANEPAPALTPEQRFNLEQQISENSQPVPADCGDALRTGSRRREVWTAPGPLTSAATGSIGLEPLSSRRRTFWAVAGALATTATVITAVVVWLEQPPGSSAPGDAIVLTRNLAATPQATTASSNPTETTHFVADLAETRRSGAQRQLDGLLGGAASREDASRPADALAFTESQSRPEGEQLSSAARSMATGASGVAGASVAQPGRPDADAFFAGVKDNAASDRKVAAKTDAAKVPAQQPDPRFRVTDESVAKLSEPLSTVAADKPTSGRSRSAKKSEVAGPAPANEVAQLGKELKEESKASTSEAAPKPLTTPQATLNTPPAVDAPAPASPGVGFQKGAPTRELAELDAVRQRQVRLEMESRSTTAEDARELARRKLEVSDKLEGLGTEAYDPIFENEFLTPQDQPLSTFSIDVDSASYANVRRFLTQGRLPPPNAVRIEELVNYFRYDYPEPAEGQPFSVTADAAPCPWQREHYIARIGLRARSVDKAQRPPTNLVFLLDVSGSMRANNKLPLVKRAMALLVEEMTQDDHISIVTYAGNAGLKLEPTAGSDQGKIMQAIDSLQAGGSTNGAAGINLAYEQALRFYRKEGANRVILCTDGDFNVGVSDDNQLVQLIQQQATSGVFLSIFGFGMGNLKDSKLEKLADKGNGQYGYIDELNEARRVFSEELVGTLYTVAKDVKLQLEFNPQTVGAYRLIGYENRALAARDFNDDTKDAGEIGAGHTVTALYEIVPRGKWPASAGTDALKYAAAQKKAAEPRANVPADVADDLFTVKLRYKQPDAATSVKTIDFVVDDIAGKKDVMPSRDLLWASSVAAFGMQLRHSKHVGAWTLDDVLETAQGAKGDDPTGRRSEFIELVQAARRHRPVEPTTNQ